MLKVVTENKRLNKILNAMEEDNSNDFFSYLTYEEDQEVNEICQELVNYLFTDMDNINGRTYVQGVEFPCHLSEDNNRELKEMLYYARKDLRIVQSYYRITPDNAIVLDQVFFQGEIEEETANIISRVFDIDGNEAWKIVDLYGLKHHYYYHSPTQYQYLVDIDELMLIIDNTEELYNNKDHIYELITELDEYDEIAILKAFDK